jgi:hypothetical protein
MRICIAYQCPEFQLVSEEVPEISRYGARHSRKRVQHSYGNHRPTHLLENCHDPLDFLPNVFDGHRNTPAHTPIPSLLYLQSGPGTDMGAKRANSCISPILAVVSLCGVFLTIQVRFDRHLYRA